MQSKLFLWYEFWKNIFCGNSYVDLGVLIITILNNTPLAKALMLIPMAFVSRTFATSDIFRGKKWNVSFTFSWTRKKWTVASHLMSFVRNMQLLYLVKLKCESQITGTVHSFGFLIGKKRNEMNLLYNISFKSFIYFFLLPFASSNKYYEQAEN